MYLVSGALMLGAAAEKKTVTLFNANGTSKRCEAERDHGSRKYVKLAFSPSEPRLAMGALDGTIVVIDTRTGKISHRFELKGDIAGLAISSSSVFAANSKSGEVVQWDMESGEEVMRFIADEDGLSSMCVLEDSGDDHQLLIATARTTISVWKNKKRVSKYTGHASNVTCMSFLKGGALVSGTAQDRALSVWPANVKKARSPLMMLTCSEPPRWIGCGPRLLEGDEASVMAVSLSGGKVFIWRIPSASDGAEIPPRPANCVLGAADKAVIVSCDFSKGEISEVLCMVQSREDLDPVLMKASIISATNEGGLIPDVNIAGHDSLHANGSVPASSVSDSAKGSSTVKRLDRSATITQVEKDASKRARATSNASVTEDDRPLMSRLLEFSGRLDDPASSTATTSSRVTAPTSLSIALEQALQTEDKEKIEAVLQTTDGDIVSQTVHRLSPIKVPILIRELGIRLQGKPGRATNLMGWITAVMEHHTPLLISDPSAREALRSVYAVADARVQTFDRLLRLKGRLDLILSRTNASAEVGAKGISNGPLITFDALQDGYRPA